MNDDECWLCVNCCLACSGGMQQPAMHQSVLRADTGDDRTTQARTRLRKKLGQRKASDSNNSNSTPTSKKSNPQKSTTNGLCAVVRICL